MNNAKITDIELLKAARLLPKPKRDSHLKADLKKFLRIIDEQDAVNRYTWYNLPTDITGQELERLLYYKGQLCFFYVKDLDKFYFMPFALDGTLDFYGRYNTVHPVPMTSGEDDPKTYKAQAALLSTMKLNCKYGVVLPEDLTINDFYSDTVLLWDYTKQLSQLITPRQILNDSLLDTMAEIIPYMKTNMKLSSGIKGLRVDNADTAGEVNDANQAIDDAAVNCSAYVPIVGKVEFQDLANSSAMQAQDYFQTLQALDSLRLSSYGIENGGLFEKKAHILQSELDAITSNIGLVMQDGLAIRQNFCDIVNSIWGLHIWVEPAEAAIGRDDNGDGRAYTDNNPTAQVVKEDSKNE